MLIDLCFHPWEHSYTQDQTLKNDSIPWRIQHHNPKIDYTLNEKQRLYLQLDKFN